MPTKEILEIILKNTDTHFAYLDRGFNFKIVNSAYVKGSGHTKSELIGKNHFQLFPNKQNQKIFEQVRKTGKPVSFFEKPFEYPDQPDRGVTYWNWSLYPVKDDKKTVKGFVLSLTDVTEQKRIKQKLQLMEQEMNTLSEYAIDIIARFDRNGRYNFVSSSIENVTGIPPENYIGKTNEELGMPEHLCLFWRKATEKVFDTGKINMVEFEYETERSSRSFQSILTPEFDKKRRVKSVLAITRDISKQKELNREIQLANERLQYLLSSSTAVIYTSKPSDNHAPTFISENVENVTGFSAEQFRNNPHFLLNHIHPDDKKFITEEIKRVFNKGQHGYEYRFKHKNGTYIWVLDEMKLVRDEKEKPLEIVGHLHDITDRKKMEALLLESKERYKMAQKTAKIGSWDLDIESEDLKWSDTIPDIFGMDKKDFDGTYQGFLERIHRSDRKKVVNAVNDCIERGKDYDIEHRIITSGGNERWLREIGGVIRNKNNKPIRMLGIVQDITKEKKEKQKKLEEVKRKSAMAEMKNIVSLLDSISSSIVLVNKRGIIKYLNRRAAHLMKLEKGNDIREIFEDDFLKDKSSNNKIVYSKVLKSSFLVKVKPYRNMLLCTFERLHKEIKRNKEIKSTLAPYNFDDIIGLSSVKELAKTLALQDVNILIQGESGTGKELFASSIHNASPRAGKKFVAINCSAIPETLFESELFGAKKGAYTDARSDRVGRIEYASGGTLFLDEIGDLPVHVQSKLLRVIEDKMVTRLGEHKPRKVDVRYIFATNRDLNSMVKNGTFREDLYYRINAPVLKIPPLRDRKYEIPKLVEKYMRKMEEKYHRMSVGISKGAIESLQKYKFPGNVRELEGILRNAYLTTRNEQITKEDLTITDSGGLSIDDRVKKYRTKLIYDYYRLQNQDVKKTAEALNMSTRQVYRYLNQASKYGLNK